MLSHVAEHKHYLDANKIQQCDSRRMGSPSSSMKALEIGHPLVPRVLFQRFGT